MWTHISKKNNFIVLGILFIAVVVSIYNLYQIINPDRWLLYWDDLAWLEKISKYSFWWYINTTELYATILYLSPILISFAAVNNFSKTYHSGFLNNIIQRTGYRKAISIEIVKAYLSALLLPIITIIILILSNIFYENSILFDESLTNGMPFLMIHDYMLSMGPFLFIFLYIILLLIFSLIVINISIILVKLIKNRYLTFLGTLLVVIFIETLGVFFIGPAASGITGITKMMNGFSLYNLLILDAIPSLIWEFIFAIIMLIITSIGIYMIYYRKLDDNL